MKTKTLKPDSENHAKKPREPLADEIRMRRRNVRFLIIDAQFSDAALMIVSDPSVILDAAHEIDNDVLRDNMLRYIRSCDPSHESSELLARLMQFLNSEEFRREADQNSSIYIRSLELVAAVIQNIEAREAAA